jgi:hypothetical protein
VTLLEIHAELAETNTLLRRIADALDRAIPAPVGSQHDRHPLIGRADVSVMTNQHAAEVAAKRATMPVGASGRFGQRTPPAPEPSLTGQWDHDDPLDNLSERGDADGGNYPGVDR